MTSVQHWEHIRSELNWENKASCSMEGVQKSCPSGQGAKESPALSGQQYRSSLSNTAVSESSTLSGFNS